MAPKAKFLMATLVVVVVVVPLRRVNSMPMTSDSSEIITLDSPAESSGSQQQEESYTLEVDDSTTESAAITPVFIEKRSLVVGANDNGKNLWESGKEQQLRDNRVAISEEQNRDDDLDTAAGTNILRPLFVYRQQLAYRERVRKQAGRRAAPNF